MTTQPAPIEVRAEVKTPDPRFFNALAPLSAADAAALAGATLASGPKDAVITRVAPADGDGLDDAAIYFDKATLSKRALPARFGLCFSARADDRLTGGAVAVTENPKLAFARLAARLHEERRPVRRKKALPRDGVDETAFIDETAEIAEGLRIGAHAVIGPGVIIGEGTQIGHGVVISHAILGARVTILPGARIGQSGFGFAEGPEGPVKIPQLGRVLIGDDVEIGANTTIDRGALDDTVIGAGSKIDNLVQIGHNVRIGRNCIIAAQCGISGSCIIGDGVMMGGQVGLADHLTIGAGAQLAAAAGLMRDVPPGEVWGGRPARPIKDWLRETAVLSKLAKKRKS